MLFLFFSSRPSSVACKVTNIWDKSGFELTWNPTMWNCNQAVYHTYWNLLKRNQTVLSLCHELLDKSCWSYFTRWDKKSEHHHHSTSSHHKTSSAVFYNCDALIWESQTNNLSFHKHQLDPDFTNDPPELRVKAIRWRQINAELHEESMSLLQKFFGQG